MKLEGKKIGFALTGSFCTFSATIPYIQKIIDEGANVIPIMSQNSYTLDTKFGKAIDFIQEIEEITNHKMIHEITASEPIGPQNLTDIMIIAPASSNTIRKNSKWN